MSRGAGGRFTSRYGRYTGYPSRDETLVLRDSSLGGAEWGKIAIGLGVLAAAGFAAFKFWIQPAAAASAQPGGGQSPGRSPGAAPSPPPSIEALRAGVKAGDIVLVSPSALSGVLGSASLPSTDIEMAVASAIAGNPILMARTTGSGGVPAGILAPVPRTAVTSVVGSGGVPGLPGFPGGLPGGIPGGLPGSIPNVPGFPSVPGLPSVGPLAIPQDMGSPLNVQQGHHYRARLQLDGFEATMAAMNPQLVVQKLQDLGLSDVQVFKAGADPLPADWPLVTVIATTTGTYYAQGTWQQADASVPRPPQVAMAWEG